MTAQNTQAVTRSVADKESKIVEYIPFGADAKIRLSVKIIQDFVCIPTKTGKVCSERDAMKFIMLCQARALNPFEGDAYLQGYDGRDGAQFSLITAHQAFLKRAELHPEYDGMESGVVVMDENGSQTERQGDFYSNNEELIGGWARVYFKNRKIPMFKKLRLDTFKKGYGVWENNPEGMIVKCAEADALRSSFPTKLGGMYLNEEQFKDTSRQFEKAKAVTASTGLLEAPSPLPLAAPEEPAAASDPQPAKEPAQTVQGELSNLADENGCTLLEFSQWAKSEGHIAVIPSTWDQFPEDSAKRLLKAKREAISAKLQAFKAEVTA